MSKYRRHLPFVFALVLVQALLPQLWRASYQVLRRPALIRNGALPCASYTPRLKEYMPRDCDLVVVTHRGEQIEETFFPRDGNAETRVVTRNGEFVLASTTYTATIAFFVLPFLALMVIAVATIHKMLRTASIFTWQLARYRADDFEATLYVYAIPVFAAGFIGQFFLQQ